ncbi:MAG: hypothetical protein ING75_17310 [Rhodocyclaceae bacterium]|nr:hypothetical protein [Rhodocyclaceae bacterium]
MAETSQRQTIEALPPRAKRVLVSYLSQPAGTRLSVMWYEYPLSSNMDKWPRERLQQAADDAGFIEYIGGHPVVTPLGHEWAKGMNDAKLAGATSLKLRK